MKQLIKETMEYLDNSYSPYSNFAVAACVKTKDHKYFGVNIENASYGLSNCAERSALFSAYSNGVTQADIECLVIVTKQDELIYPCGACRQVMVELLNQDTNVIIANENTSDTVTIQELMPKSFAKDNLV